MAARGAQDARLVDDLDAQGDDAAVAHEPAQQDLSEQAGIDIAAADDQADALAGEALAVRQHGREPGGAGALGHDLLRLRHHLHRLFQRFLLDQQDVAHQPFDDRLGEGARRFHGDALGDRLRPEHRRQVADGVMHGGIERGLDADHLDVRLERLGRRRDARHDAAAADRHDDDVEVGRIGHEFEADGALSGDDPGVVIGMDEGEVLAPGEIAREYGGGVDACRPRSRPARRSAGALDLVERRPLRHDDDGGNAEPLGEAGDALRVIARRHRDDAGLGFGGRLFSLLKAPRSLNEPVYCRFSSFSTIDLAPVASARRGAGTAGVRTTCPAIAAAARRMSSMVTVMGAPTGP